MSDKLKPCPFCGGEAIIDGCDDTPWSVICKKCAASVDFKETEQEAIDAWNNRVEFNLSPKEIEALRKKFSSAIHDIPVSYYTEVRKPCIDERTELAFTLDEIDVIARYMRQDFEGNGALERAILKKCNHILKGENVE